MGFYIAESSIDDSLNFQDRSFLQNRVCIGMRKYPELLAPAGSLEKLKIAILYGANAVYGGGLKFNLRAAANNFTPEELELGVAFCHEHHAKFFYVLNSFLHDEDLEGIGEVLGFLEEIKVDALIVSDLGVIDLIQRHCSIPIHLSTQASCLNTGSAQFWKKMGVQRLILGREASLVEAKKIKESTGLEVELFIHGSMCMAYSGNCTISNFTQGRDSNRGGCAHSCRFEYSLKKSESENAIHQFFMSSKDLNGIDLLEQFIEAGIDSIKVEGRMKTSLYVGTVIKAYAESLSSIKKGEPQDSWRKELLKISHRDYTQGSLTTLPGKESIFDEREHTHSGFKNIGVILESYPGKYALLQVGHKFSQGQSIEILPFKGEPIRVFCEQIELINGEKLEYTKPNMVIKIPYHERIEHLNIARIEV